MREFAPMSSMSTKAMAVEYSELTGQTVKRFATKADAERRLGKAREEFAARAVKNGHAPVEAPAVPVDGEYLVTATFSDPALADVVRSAALEITDTTPEEDEGVMIWPVSNVETAKDLRDFLNRPGVKTVMTEPDAPVAATEPKAPKIVGSRGAPGLKKPRIAVVVDGVEYRSAAEAFDTLGLPGKLIFWARATLKKEGVVVVDKTTITRAQ